MLRYLGALGAGLIVSLAFACGSSSRDSGFDENADKKPGDGSELDGSFGSNSDAGDPVVDQYANDPPAPWCGPAGEPEPPQPGGTLECPDDKNKPGCACKTAGEKAPCWTGLRKHRHLGVCKDGETTCIKKTELQLEWGECKGEVLPTAGATKGAGACTCFSGGQWKIANVTPCTLASDCTSQDISTCKTFKEVSTILNGNSVECPAENPPTQPPSQPWSTSTLKVDCAGHFKLCLRLRAGDFNAPSTNDCILGEVCTEGDYKEANVEQAWPDLPGWLGKDDACAAKWAKTPADKSPGYAEMIVKGQSVRCDAIDDGNGNDLVFNRTQFCPTKCNDSAHAQDAECVSCQQSGAGSF